MVLSTCCHVTSPTIPQAQQQQVEPAPQEELPAAVDSSCRVIRAIIKCRCPCNSNSRVCRHINCIISSSCCRSNSNRDRDSSNSSRHISISSSTTRNESICCELPQQRVGSLTFSIISSSSNTCNSNSNIFTISTITVTCTTELKLLCVSSVLFCLAFFLFFPPTSPPTLERVRMLLATFVLRVQSKNNPRWNRNWELSFPSSPLWFKP